MHRPRRRTLQTASLFSRIESTLDDSCAARKNSAPPCTDASADAPNGHPMSSVLSGSIGAATLTGNPLPPTLSVTSRHHTLCRPTPESVHVGRSVTPPGIPEPQPSPKAIPARLPHRPLLLAEPRSRRLRPRFYCQFRTSSGRYSSPFSGFRKGCVDRQFLEIEQSRSVEFLQNDLVNSFPDAQLIPPIEPTPAGDARGVLLGHVVPADGVAELVDDAGKACFVIGKGSPTEGLWWMRWNQGLDLVPHGVQKFLLAVTARHNRPPCRVTEHAAGVALASRWVKK